METRPIGEFQYSPRTSQVVLMCGLVAEVSCFDFGLGSKTGRKRTGEMGGEKLGGLVFELDLAGASHGSIPVWI